MAREKRDAAVRSHDPTKCDSLDNASIRLHENASHHSSGVRSAYSAVLFRPMTASRSTSLVNSLRGERSRKRPYGSRVNMHVTMRIGMREVEAAMYGPANLRAKFGFYFSFNNLPSP